MDGPAWERLIAENEALRRRVETLEGARAERDANHERVTKLERVLRELPLIVDIFDVTTARSVFKNRDLDALLGYAPGELEAMGPQPMLFKTVHSEDIPQVLAFVQRLREEPGQMADAFIEYRVNRGDKKPGWFRAHVRPFDRLESGRIATILMVTYDVSETKLAEGALRALNEALDQLVAERTVSLEDANRRLVDEVEMRKRLAEEAERRARLIRELSSPILQVWKDIVAVPIIGAIDAERSVIIQEALLAAISNNDVRFAILDLTGVGAMDGPTAEHIQRLATAATLLGSEIIMCGIGPSVARVMVEQGLSVQAITVKNLRGALRHCLRKRGADLT
jgi:rsbT co-antagonist protein RsbR